MIISQKIPGNYDLMVEKSANLTQNLKIQRFDVTLKLMMYKFLGYDDFSKNPG